MRGGDSMCAKRMLNAECRILPRCALKIIALRAKIYVFIRRLVGAFATPVEWKLKLAKIFTFS